MNTPEKKVKSKTNKEKTNWSNESGDEGQRDVDPGQGYIKNFDIKFDWKNWHFFELATLLKTFAKTNLNKIGLLLCHSHIESRLRLRWGWYWRLG